jgi:hypothetical protein
LASLIDRARGKGPERTREDATSAGLVADQLKDLRGMVETAVQKVNSTAKEVEDLKPALSQYMQENNQHFEALEGEIKGLRSKSATMGILPTSSSSEGSAGVGSEGGLLGGPLDDNSPLARYMQDVSTIVSVTQKVAECVFRVEQLFKQFTTQQQVLNDQLAKVQANLGRINERLNIRMPAPKNSGQDDSGSATEALKSLDPDSIALVQAANEDATEAAKAEKKKAFQEALVRRTSGGEGSKK